MDKDFFLKKSREYNSPFITHPFRYAEAESEPDTPSNMTAQPASGSIINLSWSAVEANPSVTGYTVEKSTNNSNWTPVTTTSSTNPDATGLSANTLYYLRVKANNSLGSSPWVSVNTTSGVTTPSGSRAVLGGGRYTGFVNTNNMEYFSTSSSGSSATFGTLLAARYEHAAAHSTTRGIFALGYPPSGSSMEYITIATTGNSSNFGTYSITTSGAGGLSDGSRAVFGGTGSTGTQYYVNYYVTIATASNSTLFGDMRSGNYQWTKFYQPATVASHTRGIFAGGGSSSTRNKMVYITIATASYSQDFGNLTTNENGKKGTDNRTRGIFLGSWDSNTICYITIATLGNATDFGDMTVDKASFATAGNGTLGFFAGGRRRGTYAWQSDIAKSTIATLGNSSNFGSLSAAKSQSTGVDNS